MRIEIQNVSTEQIAIDFNNSKILLDPCQSTSIYCGHTNANIKFYHVVNDKLNSAWFLMTELFALEQMRTVLVVDGEYAISCSCEESIVKIKDQEYVFANNFSYQTFVFAAKNCSVERRKLTVAKTTSIVNRAKFLYLFGGSNIFLPLSGVALMALLIRIILNDPVQSWLYLMAALLLLMLCRGLARYIKQLNFLKKVVKEDFIMEYLASSRKECRKASDNLIQKHLDKNAGVENYW